MEDFNSKYSGEQVEALLDQVASGNAGGGGGGGSSEKEIVRVMDGIIEVLEPNKIYFLDSSMLIYEIQSIAEPNDIYGEYCVIINATDHTGIDGDLQPSISLPEGLRWVNGSVPDITKQGVYELNIVYFSTPLESGFNAVLTRFEYVE